MVGLVGTSVVVVLHGFVLGSKRKATHFLSIVQVGYSCGAVNWILNSQVLGLNTANKLKSLPLMLLVLLFTTQFLLSNKSCDAITYGLQNWVFKNFNLKKTQKYIFFIFCVTQHYS